MRFVDLNIIWCGLSGLFEWTPWNVTPNSGWIDLGVIVIWWAR